jgi:uncharacterized membrane protein YfcA
VTDRPVVLLLLAGFTIVLVAAAVQAVTGFGFALVSVPLLALVADPRTAVVASALAALAMSATVTVRERGHADWRTAGLLVAAAMLGLPIGLLVLQVAPEWLLAALIGAAVVICALLVWRGLRVPSSRPVLVGTGVLVGVLSTSTGTSGPPLVAAFQAMGYGPRTFRATIAVVFAGTGVCSLGGFALAGQVSPQAVQVGLVGLPAVLAGWWGGNAVFRRIEPALFRGLVLVVLVVGGASVVARALASV